MADVRGRGVACDDKCGCPSPCPGGSSCRCYSSSTGGDDPNMEHKKCPCGEHCGCNPCTCPKTVTAAAGCKCAEGCACVSCA